MQELEGEIQGENLINCFCHGRKHHMPNACDTNREVVVTVITSLFTLSTLAPGSFHGD